MLPSECPLLRMLVRIVNSVSAPTACHLHAAQPITSALLGYQVNNAALLATIGHARRHPQPGRLLLCDVSRHANGWTRCLILETASCAARS